MRNMRDTKHSAKLLTLVPKGKQSDANAFRRRISDALYDALMDGIEVDDILAALKAERQCFLQQVNSPNFE